MIAATMRRENSHPTRRAPDEAFAAININDRCQTAIHIRIIDTAITLIGYSYHNRIAEGADAGFVKWDVGTWEGWARDEW